MVICTPPKPLTMARTGRSTPCGTSGYRTPLTAAGNTPGVFGWCMFDYQTHKDFGSGDRICYHGVLDSFRNPKLAAAVYASQGDADPVLAVSSSMDIGDNPAGQLGTAYVFSNAQQVKLYKNDVFVTALRQSEWTALPHPPFVMDDTIGELLETQEHFSPPRQPLCGTACWPPENMA